MDSGLFRVTFTTPIGTGSGIVVLDGGRLRGGDSMMFYVGSYTSQGSQFRARIKTGIHTRVLGMGSVFGRDEVSLTIEGEWTTPLERRVAWLVGNADEVPTQRVAGKMERIFD